MNLPIYQKYIFHPVLKGPLIQIEKFQNIQEIFTGINLTRNIF